MIGSGFGNIFKIPELKRRILFTLALLIVYRIGVHIPVPGVDAVALASFFDRARGTLLGLFDMFSGGAFEQMSVFALGIMPYISASIILQLLTVTVPHLERLSKEGEQGRKKITQYTRYGTIVAEHYSGVRHRGGTGKHECPRGRSGGDQCRLGIPIDDRGDTHCRDRIYHVARRADHRTGDRQRDFADHLCRNRLPVANGDGQHLPAAVHRRDRHLPGAAAGGASWWG